MGHKRGGNRGRKRGTKGGSEGRRKTFRSIMWVRAIEESDPGLISESVGKGTESTHQRIMERIGFINLDTATRVTFIKSHAFTPSRAWDFDRDDHARLFSSSCSFPSEPRRIRGVKCGFAASD